MTAMICCWGSASAQDTAHREDTRHLMVAVYNQAGVDALTMAHAERVAGEAYRGAGIEITWLEVDRNDDDNEFYMTVLTGGTETPYPKSEETVGFATPGSNAASVIYGRIRAVARRRHMPCGPLLGYVMAHELGHLLLPAHSHSESGVMQANLDLRLAAAGKFGFTIGQVRQLQQHVMAPRVVSTD